MRYISPHIIIIIIIIDSHGESILEKSVVCQHYKMVVYHLLCTLHAAQKKLLNILNDHDAQL